MADKLAVWNQALVHLEKAALPSLTADVEARYVFTSAWSGVVEEAFNEGDWNAFKKSVALSANGSETPAVGWTTVFDYPDDYVRSLVVSARPDFQTPFFDFVDEGGFIHTNQSVLYLRYISSAKQADNMVTEWPTMFWRYVALKLAYESCGKLTSGASLGEKLEAKVAKALRQAKSVDARNEGPRPMKTGSWLAARRGGGGTSGSGLGPTLVGGEITFGEGDV